MSGRQETPRKYRIARTPGPAGCWWETEVIDGGDLDGVAEPGGGSMLVGPDGRRYPELCSVAPHYLWSRGGPIDLQDLYDRAVEQVLVEIYEQGRYSGDEAAARFVFLLMLAVSDQNHQLRDL